jgi:hypothetical protein
MKLICETDKRTYTTIWETKTGTYKVVSTSNTTHPITLVFREGNNSTSIYEREYTTDHKGLLESLQVDG